MIINYYKSYINFINTHKLDSATCQQKCNFKIEGHHLFPKSRGGKRHNNIVWLTEFDHCIAHLLYNAAAFQCARTALRGYVPRGVVMTCKDRDVLTYWNPISKVKVRVWSDSGEESKVMSLADASKIILKVWGKEWECQQARNAAVVQVLMRCYSKNHVFAKTNFQFAFTNDPSSMKQMHDLKSRLNEKKAAIQAKLDEVEKELKMIESFSSAS